MTKAGLPADVIITKIRTSKSEFKTATADLTTLMADKVPADVISSMVQKQAENDAAKAAKPPVEFTANNAEYGSPSEFRGKTKVFLAVYDAPSREIVVKALAKERRLIIVDERAKADFGLSLELQRVDVGSNSLLRTYHNIVLVGEMTAYTYLPVKEGDATGRIRILWQKRKTQDWSGGMTLNRHPATNAINDFLNEYKKVNK